MKHITKRMNDLPEGTIVYRNAGEWVLKRYDSFHGWYEAAELIYDDDIDDVRESDQIDYLLPSDLIGCEY